MGAIRIFLTLILLLGVPSLALSAPVLYFSDITSGPATGLGDGKGSGAIVTIWGHGLDSPTVTSGSPQSGYSVVVGGVNASYVYEWGNATAHAGHPADLYTYHKMQVIMFSLGASTPSGAQTITVTTPSGSSNTLPFTIRSGTIYHVKTTGNDGTGNGSWGSPWRNTKHYTYDLNGASAGSILYVGDGVVDTTSQYGIEVSGVGTSATPFAVIAYPGAVAGATNTGGGIGPTYQWGDQRYWHVSRLVFKAPSNAYTFIRKSRFIGNELTDHPTSPCQANQSGLVAGAGQPNISYRADSDGVIFLGNYLHDYCQNLTDSQQHTTYFSNRTATSFDPFEIGWNYLYNNMSDHGLHVYDESGCGGWNGTINIHDNAVVSQRGIGIGVGPGCGSAGEAVTGAITNDFRIYNNLVIDDGRGPYFTSNGGLWSVGISVGTSSLLYGANYTVSVYNNTVYGIGEIVRDVGSNSSQGFFNINPGQNGITFRNNISYDSKNWPWIVSGSSTPGTHSNNIWYSTTGGHAGPPAWDTSPITSNPLFVNIGTLDLSLQSISPAINAGTTGTQSTADFLGVSRGSSPDIGAFEYASGGGGTFSYSYVMQGGSVIGFSAGEKIGRKFLFVAGGIGGGSTSLISGYHSVAKVKACYVK